MSSVVEIKCIRRRQQLLLSCPPNTTSEPTNIFLLEIAFAYVFHQVYTHTYTDVMRIKDFDNQVVIDEFPEIPKVNTQISWCSCKYQLADILRVLFFSPFCSTACTISWPVRWSTRPTTGVRHHGFGSTPPSPSEAYWHPNWIMWVVRLLTLCMSPQMANARLAFILIAVDALSFQPVPSCYLNTIDHYQVFPLTNGKMLTVVPVDTGNVAGNVMLLLHVDSKGISFIHELFTWCIVNVCFNPTRKIYSVHRWIFTNRQSTEASGHGDRH